MNKDKFEMKFYGGRGNGQTIYAAEQLLEYIKSLESNKIYGITNLGKGIIVVLKDEVITKNKIKEIIDKKIGDNCYKLGSYERNNATPEQERKAGEINALEKLKKELLEEE